MGAANGQDDAAQLQRLKEKIAALNSAEQQEIARRHKALGELGELEQRIGSLERELEALGTQKASLTKQKLELTGTIAASEKSATAAREQLSSLLRDAFVLGREPALKLALDGDDPATAARLLAYYGYYSRAQTTQIAALTAELARYRSLQGRLADTGRELENTVATRKSSIADLEQSRDRRKALVARLASDISRTHAQADSLRADAARLEKIVRSVRRDIAATPPPVPAGIAFGKLRGRLPWPVAGKIVDRYGSARADGELEWRAVRIAAPGGTRVHAIAYGRVVYAGWLPYYGLVLMIDHGDGFLAVYGHNEALYKQVGDRVRPGDVITTVGVSGGQPRPMLYFQLRHDDQPLDPSQWCVAGGPPRGP